MIRAGVGDGAGNSHSHPLLVGKELGTTFLQGSLVTGIKSCKIILPSPLKILQFYLLKLAPKK